MVTESNILTFKQLRPDFRLWCYTESLVAEVAQLVNHERLSLRMDWWNGIPTIECWPEPPST